jgi:hypothetical protein
MIRLGFGSSTAPPPQTRVANKVGALSSLPPCTLDAHCVAGSNHGVTENTETHGGNLGRILRMVVVAKLKVCRTPLYPHLPNQKFSVSLRAPRDSVVLSPLSIRITRLAGRVGRGDREKVSTSAESALPPYGLASWRAVRPQIWLGRCANKEPDLARPGDPSRPPRCALLTSAPAVHSFRCSVSATQLDHLPSPARGEDSGRPASLSNLQHASQRGEE